MARRMLSRGDMPSLHVRSFSSILLVLALRAVDPTSLAEAQSEPWTDLDAPRSTSDVAQARAAPEERRPNVAPERRRRLLRVSLGVGALIPDNARGGVFGASLRYDGEGPWFV